MAKLTKEEQRILESLQKAQAKKEAIRESQKIPISNPNKYSFPIGMPDTLILCPYCLGIIDEQNITCPSCNGNIKNDAPIEMTIAEYNNAPQVNCPVCNKSKLRLVKICPSCGK